MAQKSCTVADLTNVFQNGDAQGSWVGWRLLRMILESQRTETPPFPKQIQVEVSNICNHSCEFCAYTLMQRKKRHMSKELFRQVVTDAYRLGAREIWLFAGAEPLTCKWLDEYIAFCRDVGYEYQYISTNGSIGDADRFKRLLDA